VLADQLITGCQQQVTTTKCDESDVYNVRLLQHLAPDVYWLLTAARWQRRAALDIARLGGGFLLVCPRATTGAVTYTHALRSEEIPRRFYLSKFSSIKEVITTAIRLSFDVDRIAVERRRMRVEPKSNRGFNHRLSERKITKFGVVQDVWV